MNFLFVCSRNKWRSRTAETIFKDNGHHQVKSAGTANSAKIKVNEQLLKWADLIWVMEQKHKKQLLKWDSIQELKEKIIVLDIPDEYPYMDKDLIEILEASVGEYFEN